MNQRTHTTHTIKSWLIFLSELNELNLHGFGAPSSWIQLHPSKVKQFEKHLAQICGCSAVRRPGTQGVPLVSPGTPTTGATWSIISGMKPPKLEMKRQERDDFVVGELVGGSKMLKNGVMIYISASIHKPL